MEDCIFCKIIKGQKEADIIYSDEDFIVFKDINPKAPVHLLIVSKKHIKDLNSLKDQDLAGKILLLAKKIAKKQKISQGYKVLCNVGRKGGQIVDHLHFHLMSQIQNS